MRLGGVDAALETKPTQLNLQLQQPKLYATTATATGGTTKSTPPFEYSPSPHSLSRCAAPTNSTQYYPMWQQVECVLPHFEQSACDEGAPNEWVSEWMAVWVMPLLHWSWSNKDFSLHNYFPTQSFTFPAVLLMWYRFAYTFIFLHIFLNLHFFSFWKVINSWIVCWVKKKRVAKLLLQIIAETASTLGYSP